MNTRNDPRADAAWRLLLVALGLALGAGLLTLRVDRTWPEGTGPPLGLSLAAAVSYLAAWLAVVRFRWLTVRWRRTWLVLLPLAWLLLLIDPGGAALAGYLLVAPFVLRWQTGLQLLRGRWRATAFLLMVPLLALVLWGGLGGQPGWPGRVLAFARFGVAAFLLSGVLTLIFGMRLHFLRLRPKLFVTGVLVGVVPLLLLTVFGLVLLYTSLGGSRANRTADLLHGWSQAYAQGRVPAALHAPAVRWQEQSPADGPAWMSGLVTGLRQLRDEPAAAATPDARPTLQLQIGGGDGRAGAADTSGSERAAGALGRGPEGDGHATDGGTIRFEMDEDRPLLPRLAAARDTTFWFLAEQRAWLTRLRDPGPGQAEVEAVPLDSAAVQALAQLMRADLVTRGVGGDDQAVIGGIRSLRGHYAPPAEPTASPDDRSLWRRPLFFGGAFVPAPVLGEHGLNEAMLMVELQTSLHHLVREFSSPEQNVFNIAMMVAMGLLAVLLLLTGLAALMLSLRITGGIVEAVRALHHGTRRLAAGDLDTMIEVQSEDEFGDLADSFNEMTAAVKQGREDAIARERLQQEMQTARQIQERLLPHEQPLLAGWDVTGVSIPSLQVGGDYFDFLRPESGRLGIAIGDVSGKGVPAALLMSNLQASLKGQVLHPAPVAAMVTRVNDLLADSTDPHMFATFFYGELDPRTGRFTSTNAGHEPALLVRRDGTVEWLEAGGLLLGMLPDQTYDQQEVDLAAGDVLVLYTDGITEAGAPLILPGAGGSEARPDSDAADDPDDDPDDDPRDDPDDDAALFGEDRLAATVVAARGRSAVGIREAILAAVQTHLAGQPQGDDITLVVLKRGDEPAPAAD